MAAGVKRQVPADLAAGVGQLLLEQQERGGNRSPGEDDRPGADRGSAPRSTRCPRCRSPARSRIEHPVGLEPGEEQGALLQRRRDVGDVGAPAGLGPAPEVAEPGGLAARARSGGGSRASSPWASQPRRKMSAIGPTCRGEDGADPEVLLHPLEVRRHPGGEEVVGAHLLAPPLQHPGWSAEGRAAVHRGRAADHPPEEDREGGIAHREGGSVEALHRANGAAVEAVPMVEFALLHEDHRMAALGELVAHHRSPRAGSHHHHVALDVAAGPRLCRVHLLRPAMLGDPQRRLRLRPQRPLHVRGIEMHDLVEVRHQGERHPQQRVALPLRRAARPGGRRRGRGRGGRCAAGRRRRACAAPRTRPGPAAGRAGPTSAAASRTVVSSAGGMTVVPGMMASASARAPRSTASAGRAAGC